jgi:hypothetical protein
MVTLYDLEILQGSTYSKEFTYQDSEGDPIDLTGYDARMQIRQTYDAPVIIELTTGTEGGITLGDALGTITITIPADKTEEFIFKKAKYDLELVLGTNVQRVLQGDVLLSKEITK